MQKHRRRSGNLIAKNDDLILELVNDPKYEIRNDGTVWILRRNWRQTGKAKSLKNGFTYFHLKYRQVNLLVHRIIFQKFVGKLSKDLVVNHKDHDTLNNIPKNLELVTQSVNCEHAER